jgi:hypothetical protein
MPPNASERQRYRCWARSHQLAVGSDGCIDAASVSGTGASQIFPRLELLLSTEFLGGSAPCLQAIELWDIPSPALPTLLSSTCDLVGHWINDIPPTGCISPEAIVTCLAALPRLHQFNFAFKSAPPHCHRISARPVNRTVLPSLTSFTFMGPSEYLEDLVS